MQPHSLNQTTILLQSTTHLPLINFPPGPNFNTIFEQSINQCPGMDHLYDSFLKRREDAMLKISKAFQIQDKQLQATELRRLIFKKPSLQEVLYLQAFISKEEIQDDIEKSKACFQKVQSISKCYQSQLSDWKYPVDPKQMAEIGHSIDSAWDQIYKLSFYDPSLIQEICELEWFFRAREVLGHERTDYEFPYVKHCEDLQKGATEGQSEKIKGSVFYKRVEEELIRYERLMKKVKGLQDQADPEEIHRLLEELKEFGFGMKEEIQSLEKILREVISQIQQRDVEQNYDKNAIVQDQLADFMDSVLQDISRFDVTAQRSQEEKLGSEIAKRILLANKELLSRLAMDMISSRPNDETCEKQRISGFVQELIRNLQLHPPKFEEICEWSQSIREFKLYSEERDQIKAELCLSKIKFIKLFCETSTKPSITIPFQDLCKLFVEIKGYYSSQYLLEDPGKESFEGPMIFLKDLIKKVKEQIQTEVAWQRENEWRPPKKMIYNFIDIDDELIQLKREFQSQEKISQVPIKALQNKTLESLNKKRGTTCYPEEEEISLYNPLVKKIKGEQSYQTVNKFEFSQGLEKRASIFGDVLAEEIIGDARKRDRNEKNLGKEVDFVIKKKGTKKYLNESSMENFEQNDCQVRPYYEDQINGFFINIDDGFKLKKKNKNEIGITENKNEISKRN